jgi:hypothetical protein
MESLGKLRSLLIATCIVWLSVALTWVAIDIEFVRGVAVILALISTTTIWSMWALNEYGISVDGTPHEQEKPKRVTGGDEDARLGLLLSLLTPDERDALKSRITQGLNAEGEVVSLADLLADQAPNDLYEHKA